MTSEKSKEEYYRDAAQYLNTGERVVSDSGDRVSGTLAFLTRGRKHTFLPPSLFLMVSQGIQQLATGSMEDALRSFDGVLAQNSTNLVAILGKVLHPCTQVWY